MIHPELQKLLDYALQSGELTQNHKDLIFRKAQELGQDLVTLELAIEKKIKQVKKKAGEFNQGSVICSNCKNINANNIIKCGVCGFRLEFFESDSKMDRVQNIIKELQKIENEWSSQMNSLNARQVLKGAFLGNKMLDGFADRKMTLINTIVLPNDTAELIKLFEFFDTKSESYFKLSDTDEAYLQPQHKKIAFALVGKASQCYSKLNRFATSNPQVLEFVTKHEKKYGTSNKRNQSKAFEGSRFNLGNYLQRIKNNPIMWFSILAPALFILMGLIAKLIF